MIHLVLLHLSWGFFFPFFFLFSQFPFPLISPFSFMKRLLKTILLGGRTTNFACDLQELVPFYLYCNLQPLITNEKNHGIQTFQSTSLHEES